MQAAGGRLSPADLPPTAREVDPLSCRIATTVFATQTTGGPTLATRTPHALAAADPADSGRHGRRCAHALQEAYAFACTPWVTSTVAVPRVHHFCVVTASNMAAVTRTLLSLFGSRFMLPESAC